LGGYGVAAIIVLSGIIIMDKKESEKEKKNSPHVGSFCTASFKMILVMIISGVGGSFLYYAYLYGLLSGDFTLDRLSWSRCVGAAALMLSVSAALVVEIFFAKVSMFLILALWPIFILALQPGYSLTASRIKENENPKTVDPSENSGAQ